jgi:hypothetical protein
VIRSSVKAFDQFPALTKQIEGRVKRALEASGEEMVKVARGAGASRGATDVDVLPVHGTETGYSVGIRGRWYYRFQSSGTLGNALNPKRPGRKRSHAPGTGVTPNRMYQQARAAGRKKLRALLKQL